MTRTLGLIIAVAVLALILVTVGPAACQKIRSQGAQSRVQQGQAEALSNSAQDAIATQGAVNERERASEELTTANEKEIRNATGAEIKIHPDVSAAGLRALCVRDAYRNHERCRLLRADPR